MKKAAETPGAIAGNEVVQTGKQTDAARALVNSRERAVRAAEAVVASLKEMQRYLKISAPFDGVVTDRLIHPGALVGPGSGDTALLVLQQIAHLRLIVAVPEEDTGGVAARGSVDFKVPAFPERTFSGVIARSAHALDPKTRTMAVELDVVNRDGALSPGMYPAVKWPVRQPRPALYVPRTSVVTTTERTFVIRDHNGHAEWVDVRKMDTDGALIGITGNLRAGDSVVKLATDELREGTALQTSSH
jgi:membrane fusion protein, multidrug efflux system